MRIYLDTCSIQRPLDDKEQPIKILCQEIGVVNTIRFINQFTTGYGDYTAEREHLFADLTLEDIISGIRHNRQIAQTKEIQQDSMVGMLPLPS
ncbi:hypothetical protein QUF58_05960 [Anaerolineales bacterium HSG24]|nr:hypothetical protein [Anaerolineales bacterium HSG24]